jgi:hypothetical protein
MKDPRTKDADPQIKRYLSTLPPEQLDCVRHAHRCDVGITIVWSWLPSPEDEMKYTFEDSPLMHTQLGKYDDPEYDK